MAYITEAPETRQQWEAGERERDRQDLAATDPRSQDYADPWLTPAQIASRQAIWAKQHARNLRIAEEGQARRERAEAATAQAAREHAAREQAETNAKLARLMTPAKQAAPATRDHWRRTTVTLILDKLSITPAYRVRRKVS